MVHAFVLVDCGAGSETGIVETLRGLDAVTDAHVVAGDFDVVVETEGEQVRDLLKTVTRDVRSIDGVGTTRTYVSLE
jgi:DNA-binding Lrp family transcriptional regulator